MSLSDGRSEIRGQVLSGTDIVELIGRSVQLKKRGKDYVGLCPFHNEKSPSFTVSPTKQFFHCYGCKAGGTAIDFVMKRDRIEFFDALKLLAGDAGIELPRGGAAREKAGERQLLMDAQSAACAYFESVLADPELGAAARGYLQGRGFNDASIKQFQIGLAPDAWDGLLRGPVGRRFSPPQLVMAGLAKAREGGGGFYDTFRNRLMFPIRAPEGRVLAFGGRVMPGSDDKAKYLNSPETPLFSKKNCVFGLDLARQRIVETRTAVIVEGYTDVVMSHQFGASNVVSILGTAMTEEHVKLLRRFADRIVLLFDADAAGDSAVDRSLELFLTQPIEISIASLPAEVDPDEFLLKEGVEGFEKLIAGAPDALTYTWKRLDRQFRAADGLTGQQKAVEQYLELLASARGAGPVDALRWGAALARVSRLTDIPVPELNRRFRGVKPRARTAQRFGPVGPAVRAGARSANDRTQRTGPAPATGADGGADGGGGESRPAVAPVSAGNDAASLDAGGLHTAGSGAVGSGAADANAGASIAREQNRPSAPVNPRRPLLARDRTERRILGVLLAYPNQWRHVQKWIGVDDFTDESRRELARIYWDYQQDEGEPVFNEFLGILADPTLRELAVEALDEIDSLTGGADPKTILAEAQVHLQEEGRARDGRKLAAALHRTSEASDDQDMEILRRLTLNNQAPHLRRAR